MEIKKRPQRASYVPKEGYSRKCAACNGWLKKGECLSCHFRNKQKEEQVRAEENVAAPVKPNVRIGKI